MGPMNTPHAPDRCAPRAARIAKVKFVMLPMPGSSEASAKALAPVQTGAQSPTSTLRSLLLRVIGRLEAARP